MDEWFGEGVEGLAQRLATAKPDVFRYVLSSPLAPDIPYHIRVFVRRRPASLLGRAVHNQHTLAVALRTAGGAVVDDRFLRLVPGQALLIFPRQMHDYVDLEQQPVFWLFCGFLLPDNAGYAALRHAPVWLGPAALQEIAALARLTVLAGSDAPAANPSREVQAALRVKLLLELLLEQQGQALSAAGAAIVPAPADQTNRLVALACRYINAHLADPIGLEDIAASLHVSPGHLRNEFHRLTGCSLGRHLRYLKMHHACALLDTTDLSLAQIGAQCGYSSIYSFSRAFKGAHGVAPGEYRRRQP